MKVYKNALSMSIMLILFMNFSVAAQPNRSSICHMTDTFDFGYGLIAIGHEITIAGPALDAHIRHGDAINYVLRNLPDSSIVCSSDMDNDGAGDDMDAFPNDPTEQFDTDGDGVGDNADQCPSTDPGVIVNESGCPFVIDPDTDDDGVADSTDQCPFTPDLSQYGNPYVVIEGFHAGCVWLPGADLGDANLGGANLSYANLSDTNMADTYLAEAILTGANLSGAFLSGTHLQWADLSYADLSFAYIRLAQLGSTNLSFANLSGADLNGTGLAEWEKTYLANINFEGAWPNPDPLGNYATIWVNVICPDLSVVSGVGMLCSFPDTPAP